MAKFNVGDRVEVVDYPTFEGDVVIPSGLQGTVVEAPYENSSYIYVVTDEPVSNDAGYVYGTPEEPVLFTSDEIKKVSE